MRLRVYYTGIFLSIKGEKKGSNREDELIRPSKLEPDSQCDSAEPHDFEPYKTFV